MLLSPASLKLMGKGFILGDFLGIIPFSWNPGLERPELNLSRKRIAGCVVSLVMTIIGAGVMMGRLGSFGKWGAKDYSVLSNVLFCVASSGFQIFTALSCKKLPWFFLEIQFFAKSFTGS